MITLYTIYGGDMWRSALNGVVTIVGSSSFSTLLHIVEVISVLGVMASFLKKNDPMIFLVWLAVFVIITSFLLVPKRSVQIVDITDPAGIYEVDNVPAGLAMVASYTTGAGYGVAQVFDYALSRPDSLTYSKSGMLFGSSVVSQSADLQTLNPQLGQMLPDYVKSCVIGDIELNHKYTVHDLLNSTDPLSLITSSPSPLRGMYRVSNGERTFVTCQEAAVTIKSLMASDVLPGSDTFHTLATRIFGSKIGADSLLSQAMGDSYGYFYAGGLSASQIMRNNITSAAIRQGWRGFSAGTNDTANLVNLASESSLTKMRLSWATGGVMATRMLPLMQSMMMLILVCLFPLVIALALLNHSVFGFSTLKLYAGGFLYFQMWPVMYAILNFVANFYLQSKTGGTPLVLANQDQVALQHSDMQNLAGYLSLSIPLLSFYLTRGAASVGSQVVGSVMSSAALSSSGQASTTADGNWSFNNQSMDNLSANKFDNNLSERSGAQSHQLGNGAMHTQTADGHNVYDTSGAISNLPVNMRLSALASSGYQEQARHAQQQAQSSLDGYNHSVTSGFQQMSQLTRQNGNSDTVTQGSDSSVASNASRGASMMQSSVESYAKSHNVSEQQAYNALMDISNQGSMGAGARGYVKWDSGDQIAGKLGKWATGLSAGGEANVNADWRHTSGSSHGTQDSHAEGRDFRNDQNSQEARDFRQGMDMVTSSRLSTSGSHTDNQSASQAEQFAATLNDAKSQYHQYTNSNTRSQEFSRMATMAQNQSANLDANYNQAFVDWTTAKYGNNAQGILTNVESARTAATEFMHERLEPEIMHNYGAQTHAVNHGPLQASTAFPASEPTASSSGSSGGAVERGRSDAGNARQGMQHRSGDGHTTHQERNLTMQSGQPSQTMADSFSENQRRIAGESSGAGIRQDTVQQVTAQRSDNSETISKNSGNIAENKTTVQASSDKLHKEQTLSQQAFTEGHNAELDNQGSKPQEQGASDIQKRIEQLRRAG